MDQNNNLANVSKEFILKELRNTYDYWMHIDKRIDNSINLFITLLTLIIPTSFLLYDKISESYLKNALIVSMILISVLSGYLLLIRLYKTDKSRSIAMYSINLIKRYFVDKNIGIEQYIYFHKYKPTKERSSKEKYIKPKFHIFISYIIMILNGLLIGLIAIIINSISSKSFVIMFNCESILFGLITAIIIIGLSVIFVHYKFNNTRFD